MVVQSRQGHSGKTFTKKVSLRAETVDYAVCKEPAGEKLGRSLRIAAARHSFALPNCRTRRLISCL